MGDGGSHEGLYKQGFNNNYGTVHGIIGLQISNINLYNHILMEIYNINESLCLMSKIQNR